MNFNNEDILGYRVISASKEACVQKIYTWITDNEKRKYFVCANPHSLEIASKDVLFSEAIRKADMVIPDGVGILLASRILGGEIRDRVTGTDIFLGVSRVLSQNNHHRYYFLGSSEATLRNIRNRMQKDFPSIGVAGVYSPPFAREFTEEENTGIIDAINNTRPDVLWVGMTAPRQEKWIYQNKDRLNVKFIGAIGAVFDFYAGTVKRPHPWFLDHGLEWLPRLLGEPRRLWKRMFVSAPLFMARVLAERIRR